MFTFLSSSEKISESHPDFIAASVELKQLFNTPHGSGWLGQIFEKLERVDKKAKNLFVLNYFLGSYTAKEEYQKAIIPYIDFNLIHSPKLKQKFLSRLLDFNWREDFQHFFTQPSFQSLQKEHLLELGKKALSTHEYQSFYIIQETIAKPYNRLSEENFQEILNSYSALLIRSDEYRHKAFTATNQEYLKKFFVEYYETTYQFLKNQATDYYENYWRRRHPSMLCHIIFSLDKAYFKEKILPQASPEILSTLITDTADNNDWNKMKELFSLIEEFSPHFVFPDSQNLIETFADNDNLEALKELVPSYKGNLLEFPIVRYPAKIVDMLLTHVPLPVPPSLANDLVARCLSEHNIPLYRVCAKHNLHTGNHNYQNLFHAFAHEEHAVGRDKEERREFLSLFIQKEADPHFILLSEEKGLVKLDPVIREQLFILTEQKNLSEQLAPTPEQEAIKKKSSQFKI